MDIQELIKQLNQLNNVAKAETKVRHFEKLLRYLASRDCGLSAKAIIYRMNDVTDVYIDHPRDPDDFRRCILLLTAFPEYRLELHHMKDVSPEWSLLVDHWTELEKLYWERIAQSGSDNLYNRMKELFNSIPCKKCGNPLNGSYHAIDGIRYHFDCAKSIVNQGSNMPKIENLYGQLSTLQNGIWQHYKPQRYDACLAHFRNQVAGYGEWAIFADIGGKLPGCEDRCFFRQRLRLLACSKDFRLPEGYVLPTPEHAQEIHFCGEG